MYAQDAVTAVLSSLRRRGSARLTSKDLLRWERSNRKITIDTVSKGAESGECVRAARFSTLVHACTMNKVIFCHVCMSNRAIHEVGHDPHH